MSVKSMGGPETGCPSSWQSEALRHNGLPGQCPTYLSTSGGDPYGAADGWQPSLQVKDLLRFSEGGEAGGGAASALSIREEVGGTVTVSGLSRHEVSSVEAVSALLYQGALCRATASTHMNTHSSR